MCLVLFKKGRMWSWEKLNGLTYVVAKVEISHWEMLAEFYVKITPHIPLPPSSSSSNYQTHGICKY